MRSTLTDKTAPTIQRTGGVSFPSRVGNATSKAVSSSDAAPTNTYDQACNVTTRLERLSPSGHFKGPFIQDGHFDVASTHAPNGINDAAAANITTVAGMSHHKAITR